MSAASEYAATLRARTVATPAVLAGGTATPIRRAAIIGGGLMASQLALLLATDLGGVPVVMIELDAERATRARDLVRRRLERLVKRGAMTPAEAETALSDVSATSDWNALDGADLVVEAIYEELEAKRAVFAQAEGRVDPSALLATNTSSLSISAIASGLTHPERVIGFHVFNPVEVVPLVEIIPGEQTGRGAVATAVELGIRLNRRLVFCRDAPGFIVNRLLTRMFDQIFRAIDAGFDPEVADAALGPIGLPMSPLRLLDFVGPAVQLHVSETMHAAFRARFGRPRWLSRVVDAGLTRVLEADGSLTAPARALVPPAASEAAPDLLGAVLDALADESRRMIDDGVVESAEDIDYSLLFGANWPDENGGLTPLLDRTGASERATGRTFGAA